MRKGHSLPISSEFVILPNEKVIFRVHPHWLVLAVPEACLGILTGLSITYLPIVLEAMTPNFAGKIWVVLAGAFVFVGVVIFLDWLCTSYYLTNLRLIDKRGIIGKRIVSISLDKVQDVTYTFGILGRIFGYGDIEIESAGTYGKIVFDFAPRPEDIQERIERTILLSTGLARRRNT
jgi:uncharacterized membrane protein YdbT with pleckstrin-like domain